MRTQFSGREVAKVLINYWNYDPAGRTGSHAKFRWEAPNTSEVRMVVVPMTTDPLPEGTLRSIANQCGAKSFRRFCKELDRCL
ncbi:type II toxin-antitoxin system HicA family toxin [Halobaculum sp. MBLA0143]|uniref:type II toxin-antitoxin system HicA family toxin n=1 Tax=Halobaculum sp. MBLA0143 TaxID=3079933 RepID=UPI003523CE88